MSFTLKYQLSNPVFLLEQGKRPYLEDAIYPAASEATPESRIFMVCDGVGGSTRGDEASRLTCTFFPSLVSDHLEKLTASDYAFTEHLEFLSKRLIKLEDQMDEHIHQHPEFRGMATTVTYLHLSPYGVIMAWAGDSRIYQIRNGERFFRTEDHSLVNELVRRGEITEEEAARHPRKNVILRAVSGAGNPAKLDLRIRDYSQIEDGDYFLACTDGIIDGIEEAELCQVVGDPTKSLEEKRDLIREKCVIHSRDNFAMYLIKVEAVEKIPMTEIITHSGTTATGSTVIHSTTNHMFDSGVPVFDDSPVMNSPKTPKAKKIGYIWMIWLLGIIIAVALAFSINSFINNSSKDNPQALPPVDTTKSGQQNGNDKVKVELKLIDLSKNTKQKIGKTDIQYNESTGNVDSNSSNKTYTLYKETNLIKSYNSNDVKPYQLNTAFILFVPNDDKQKEKEFSIHFADSPDIDTILKGKNIYTFQKNRESFFLDDTLFVYDKVKKVFKKQTKPQ